MLSWLRHREIWRECSRSVMEPFLDFFSGEEGNGGERRESLPPEVIWCFYSSPSTTSLLKVEEGNIEYKLKLLNPSSSRFEHLVTQLKWRLQEGQGEAIYEIGVADCGTLMGLNDEELTLSLETLLKMAKRLTDTGTTIVYITVNLLSLG